MAVYLPDGNAVGPTSVKVPAGPMGVQGLATPRSRTIDSYINRAPDPRLNSIIKTMKSPLRLGIIQQTDDWMAAIQNQAYPYACRFMFNPPVINVNYQVATSQLPAGQQTVDQLAAAAIYPGATGLSFDLMFDRTYEVAYGPGQSNPQDLRKVGVYHDIQALENVVGVRNSANYTGATVIDASGKVTAGGTSDLIGNMLMVPVYVLFGGGANGVGLAYVGFFTSISVQYTLFSQNMVPTRALVSLQFTQIIGRGVSDLKSGTVIDRAHLRNTTASPARVPTPTGRMVARAA